MTSWSVRTSHARLLLCIARDPGVRLRDIAAGPGGTERSAYGIVTDLTAAGYAAKQKDGRRNRYRGCGADAAAVLEDDRYFGPDAPGGGEGDFEPGFCDPCS